MWGFFCFISMKISIALPKTANDIPLSRYQEFLQIEEPTENDVLAVFGGFSDKAISKIPTKEIGRITAHLTGLLNENPLQRTFTMDGQTYGFIPKLDDISWGENQDVSKYMPNNENKGEHLHRAMAVLYRPITYKKGKKYLIEDYEGSDKYAEVMKEMPMGVALGAMGFFLNLLNDLLKAIPNYIQREVGKQMDSLENGEHITNYIQLLKETLEDLTLLQKPDFTNV
jgi:hypothetical protein